MAYASQELKAKVAPRVKAICQKYGVKATLAVRHHSSLVLNVRQGEIDFFGNYNDTIAQRDPTGNRHINRAEKYIQVNTYWYHEHFSGRAKNFLAEVLAVMNEGNHDRSDAMTDYFDVGWYVDVNIGKWDKPYALVK